MANTIGEMNNNKENFTPKPIFETNKVEKHSEKTKNQKKKKRIVVPQESLAQNADGLYNVAAHLQNMFPGEQSALGDIQEKLINKKTQTKDEENPAQEAYNQAKTDANDPSKSEDAWKRDTKDRIQKEVAKSHEGQHYDTKLKQWINDDTDAGTVENPLETDSQREKNATQQQVLSGLHNAAPDAAPGAQDNKVVPMKPGQKVEDKDTAAKGYVAGAQMHVNVDPKTNKVLPTAVSDEVKAASANKREAEDKYRAKKDKLQGQKDLRDQIKQTWQNVGDVDDGTNPFVKQLYSRGELTPKVGENIRLALQAANPTPVQRQQVALYNEVKNIPEDERTDMEQHFLNVVDEFEKIGDAGDEYRKAVDAYYKAVEGKKDRSEVSEIKLPGDMGYAIVGNGHNWILRREHDDVENADRWVLRIAPKRFGTYEAQEQAKKDMRGASKGEHYAYERAADTSRHVLGKFGDDLESALALAKSQAKGTLESDAKLMEWNPYNSRRTNNEHLSKIVQNRIVGHNIMDPEFVNWFNKEMSKAKGYNGEMFTPASLADMVRSVMFTVGNGKEEPMFAIDLKGNVDYADRIPKDQRALSAKEFSRATKMVNLAAEAYDENGNLKDGFTENADGTITKHLKNPVMRGISKAGLTGTERWDEKAGEWKKKLSATGIGSVDWTDPKRAMADIEVTAQDLGMLGELDKIDMLVDLYADAVVADHEARTGKEYEMTPERKNKIVEKVYHWAGLDDLAPKEQADTEKYINQQKQRLNRNVIGAIPQV